MSNKMYFIGVDPGEHGAIAVVDSSLVVMGCCSLEGLTALDIEAFLSPFLPQARLTVLEKVHAMPGNGSVSMFKFGANVERLRTCLLLLRVAHEEVTPQKWQAGLGLPKAKDKQAHKRNLKAVAEKHFGGQLRVTLGNADALLLARHAVIVYSSRAGGL